MKTFVNIVGFLKKFLLSYVAIMVIVLMFTALHGLLVRISEVTGDRDWLNILMGSFIIFVFAGAILGFWWIHPTRMRFVKVLQVVVTGILSTCIASLIYFIDIGIGMVMPSIDFSDLTWQSCAIFNLYSIVLWLIIFAIWYLHIAEEGDEAVYYGLGLANWNPPPTTDDSKPNNG